MHAAIDTQRDLPPDLGALYDAEGARLWRAVYAYARDRDVASDAVAEAFAQCLRRGDAVRDPRAWVWRSAFRIAAGELKRRGTLTHDVPERSYEMELDAAEALVETLGRLSPTQRAVVLLRHYAGEPTDVIAATLGMSRATVRVHLYRARVRLAALLEEDEG
jgi:RNA polymerase sigma-70 factor (ECF subfamily)